MYKTQTNPKPSLNSSVTVLTIARVSLFNQQNKQEMTTPPPPHPRRLQPQIWRACAGASVQFHTVNSRVYYFPEGHMDQASSPPHNLSPLLLSRPCILCTVSAVQFLADPITDEVFVKLGLIPVVDFIPVANPLQNPIAGDGGDDDSINSFVKILTPSDANNGGGFSVPRFCAESIFPPLNFNETPPSQSLKVTDVQGKVWEFRHIYRGTPKRHLLTSGWNSFVNHKKLIAGDSAVFMKNSREELFIGIRRVNRASASSSGSNGDGRRYLNCTIGGERNIAEERQQEENSREGFSRNGKGKLSPESVAEAAELAALKMPFEVVYYPKAAGWSDFVVKAEAVNEAVGIMWSPGMRVKMAMETDDSSKMTSYQGVISSFPLSNNGPWQGSPWRMLQITWDEPEVLKNFKWVSPWQVELVHSLLVSYPSTKKLRGDDGFWMPTDEGGYPFSMTGFTNSTMGYLNQTFLSNVTSPAGMQGARHNQSSESSFSAFLADSMQETRHNQSSESSFSKFLADSMQGTRHNSESSFSKFLADNSRFSIGESSGNNTVPNVGISQPDGLSPDSNSLPPLDAAFVPNQSCNSIKPRPVSFQLFGVVIQTEQPVESGLHGTGCIVDEASGRVQTIIS